MLLNIELNIKNTFGELRFSLFMDMIMPLLFTCKSFKLTVIL